MRYTIIKVWGVVLLTFLIEASFAQDFVRVGIAGDLRKSTIVQTISVDVNRTEKIDEKVGRYFLFNNKNLYILPSVDVNIGEKVTSSENNITAGLVLGKKFMGAPHLNGVTVKAINKAIEINPTYTSDKNFEERLLYGQLKGLFNVIKSRTKMIPEPYIKRGMSLSFGPFSNIGLRKNNVYKESAFFMTAGLLGEYKYQVFKKKDEADPNEDSYVNWMIKAGGNYYYVLSDLRTVYDNKLAGNFKFSIDKQIVPFLFAGIVYKLGNDNPRYTDLHTLEFAVKLNY